MADVTGPVFVLFGAAGGIGSAVARLLSERGGRLLLAGRSPDKLKALQAEVGGEVFPLDATRYDEVDAAVDRAVGLYGRVDGIACLVGSILIRAAHQTSQAQVQAAIDMNLHPAFAAVRAGARAMKDTGGSVVLMSSTAARVGLPNHEAISAAKAAIIGLTQSAAATYAPIIRVNCVAPGLTRTPLAQPIISSEPAERASIAMHPLGRLGEPIDVARVVAFLLGAESGWMTGQTVGVDGGLSTVRQRIKV